LYAKERRIRPGTGRPSRTATTDIGADEVPATTAIVKLMRADLTSLTPRTPEPSMIFPFSPSNPLTPVIKDPFVAADTDPTPGILSNDTLPLSINAIDPEPAGSLLAVKETAGDTVRIEIR